MRPKVILSVLVGLALLMSFGVAVKDAKADAILFPWIVKSDSVSTLISIVNTCGPEGTYGGDLVDYRLHYEYWYKETSANLQTEICLPHSDKIPTSKDDIITFDASCNINNGEALFNDPSPYAGASFCLNEDSPRRAFLLVDNNSPAFVDDGVNEDGTLYGEAMIVELNAGAAWGYIAYNPSGGETSAQSDPVHFMDSLDLQGEVLSGRPVRTIPATPPVEVAPVVLMPPDNLMTRFFLTPVAVVNTNNPLADQRMGNINATIQLCTQDSITGEFVDGIYDSDENPMDGTPDKDIVCTSADNLSSLINPGNYNTWESTGEQGWAYVVISPGTIDADPFDLVPDNPSSQMIVGKLEYAESGTSFDGRSVPGAINNFTWLRNSTTVAGSGGINSIHNIVP